MVARFINTTPLQAGESLIGYIIRLTELNHYDKPSRVLALAGLPNIFSTTPTAPVDLTLLANLAAVPLEELQRRTYPALKSSALPVRVVSFFGHPVAHSIIRNETTKVCLICLQEFGYCRAVWDLLPVTTCPLHGCLLMRHCPKCQNRVSSKRRKLCVCDCCNFDWRNSKPTTVAAREIRLAQRVHELNQLPTSTSKDASFPPDNPLVSLDLCHLFTTVIFLAGQKEGFTDITGSSWESPQSHTNPHDSFIRTLRIFDNWPNRFWSFLDSLSRRRGDLCDTGIKRSFGQFYRTLFRRLPSAQFDFLRSAFRDYVEDNPVFRSDAHRIRFGHSVKRKFITKLEAQRQLGTGRTVNDLIKAGKLKTITRRTHLNRKIVLVNARDVLTVRRRFESALNIRDTAERLGVCVQSVTDLIEQKCLQPLRGPTVDGYPGWRFTLESIKNLERQIIKRNVQQDPESPTITFHHALKIVQRVGFDVGKFVRALLDGQINSCHWNQEEKILAGLSFPKQQISELAGRIVQNHNGDAVYAQEAARILRLNTGSVIHLCKSGIIAAKQAHGYARKGWLIKRAAIADFSANYVRAADLANDLNTNSGMMIQILATKEIQPIATVRRDNKPQYIFRKEDLKSVDWVQIVKEINVKLVYSMPGKTFTSAEAAAFLRCAPATIPTLVINGLLKPVAVGTKQPSATIDYTFTGHSIKKYLRNCEGRADLVSGKVAAKMLNEKSHCFHNTWVNSGRLKRFKTQGNRGRLCYFVYDDVQEIALLKNTTVTSIEAARFLGVSLQHLSKLGNRGVLTPVSGPKIDGCGRNRYLRSVVEDSIVVDHAKRI